MNTNKHVANPKNHRISKLVVWRPKTNPASYRVVHPSFLEGPMILREDSFFFRICLLFSYFLHSISDVFHPPQPTKTQDFAPSKWKQQTAKPWIHQYLDPFWDKYLWRCVALRIVSETVLKGDKSANLEVLHPTNGNLEVLHPGDSSCDLFGMVSLSDPNSKVGKVTSNVTRRYKGHELNHLELINSFSVKSQGTALRGETLHSAQGPAAVAPFTGIIGILDASPP